MKEEFYCPYCGFLTIEQNIVKVIEKTGGICPMCHKDPKTATYFDAHKTARS